MDKEKFFFQPDLEMLTHLWKKAFQIDKKWVKMGKTGKNGQEWPRMAKN